MMNKKTFIFSIILGLTLVLLIFAQSETEKEKTETDKLIAKKVMDELYRERESLKNKEDALNRFKGNLESFESSLNKKYDEYLKRKAELEKREKAFNKKVEDARLDSKTIESYENIDPEQAAILMQEMYKKDPKLPPLIIKKISGKKAGKIIEALIELDTKTSAQLAKDVIDYFKYEDKKE